MGHTTDGSGLQQHSIGGLYPYIIVHKPYDKTFEVSHRDGITRSAGHASYDAACSHANGLKQREAYFAKLGAAADAACEAASISKTLDDLVGKRVILAKRQRVRIAGTVTKAYHRARLVAVRFDTDTQDTHLSPTDLRVI